MGSRLKNLIFWKKFSKFFILAFSIFLIALAFNKDSVNVNADYNCPSPITAAAISYPSNNQVLAKDTNSTTVSWNTPQTANVSSYKITVTNRTTGSVIYSNDNYVGNSVSVSPLINGNTYGVLIFPKNNCGNGTSSEIGFSVASALTTCTNPPIWCSGLNEDEGTYVYPDPANNCIATCPSGLPGQLNCTITNQLVASPNRFRLMGNPTNFSAYRWNLTGGFNTYNDAYGQTIETTINTPTTVRLRVEDAYGNFGTCSTPINPQVSGNPGNLPICSITASPQSGTSPLSVAFNATVTSIPSGGYIRNYGWDLDGDGSYFDGSSNTYANKTYYNSSGYNQTPRIGLQITDSNNNTNYCYTNITVYPTNPSNTCSQDPYTCSNGTVIYRQPSQSCSYDYNMCNTSGGGQCRSLNCNQPQLGCYYINQITYTCDPNVQLTCGTQVCPGNQYPPVNNPINPGLPGNIPFGNYQQTNVNVSNANSNSNSNINDSFSNSSSTATGGYSWASAGAGGSANVNITD